MATRLAIRHQRHRGIGAGRATVTHPRPADLGRGWPRWPFGPPRPRHASLRRGRGERRPEEEAPKICVTCGFQCTAGRKSNFFLKLILLNHNNIILKLKIRRVVQSRLRGSRWALLGPTNAARYDLPDTADLVFLLLLLLRRVVVTLKSLQPALHYISELVPQA